MQTLAKTEEGKDIPNKYDKVDSFKKDAYICIAKLDFADLWRKPSTIAEGRKVRIDIQNPGTNGLQNIQIQINGLIGKSTIATVLIDGKSLAGETDKATQIHILRRVKHALNNSLETGKIYSVLPKTDKEINEQKLNGEKNKYSNIDAKKRRKAEREGHIR